MNPQGEVQSERALGHDGRLLKYGPLYVRSASLHVMKSTDRFQPRASVTKRVLTVEGHLSFHRDDEKYCIQSTREYATRIKGIFLEKSLVENNYTGKFRPNEDFYPILRKMLQNKTDWSPDLCFSGLATFMSLLMEWTQQVIERYEQTLRQADIYGLTAISQFPYMLKMDVWKAFCELWGPLTNTLHHGGGEISISLNDMKHIGGLSILGEPYEEFLPPNKQLTDKKAYPPTVLELLQIHADICKASKALEVPWEDWLAHFYRGKQKYVAFGEDFVKHQQKKQGKRDIRRNSSKPLSPSSVSRKGELAAFLALLLSRFLLPHGSPIIRSETFVMACLMAEGRRISLAPAVLGHIYHGLNKVAKSPNPGCTKSSFGIHFIVGWLAEYFPTLYHGRPVSEFPEGYPRLACYAGVNGRPLSIHQARLVFRLPMYVFHRSIPFGEVNEIKSLYVDKASDANFEQILCIRSCVLPVRVGSELILEPYYPNRFARQFRFDQAILSNSLKFRNSQRGERSLEDIASCYARFFSKRPGVFYCIPCIGGQGICTWSFCTWWVAASTPFLRQSINEINVLLVNKDIEPHLKDVLYTITNLRKVVNGLKGPVKVSEVYQLSSSSKGSDKPNKSSASFTNEPTQPIVKISSNKKMYRDRSPSEDVNPKRLRYNRSSKSDESVTAESAGLTLKSAARVSDTIVVDIESMPQLGASVILPELEQDPPSLFSDPVPDVIRRAIVDGVKSIVETLSALESSPSQTSARAEALQNLEALKVIAGAIKVNNASLAWIDSRVHEFLEGVEVVATLEGELDTTSLNGLSTNLSRYDAELESDRRELSQLHEKSLGMKERKKKITAVETKLQKMIKDFDDDNESLKKETVEVEKRIKHKEAKKHSLQETKNNTKTQLEELKQKKDRLQLITKALASVASSG